MASARSTMIRLQGIRRLAVLWPASKASAWFFFWFCISCKPALSAPRDIKEFGRFRAVLGTGERIDGKHGVLRDSSLTATLASGRTSEFPKRDLRLLDVVTGTHVVEGFAIGASIGGLVVLAAVLRPRPPGDSEVDFSGAAPAMVGAMALLGGLGAAIGAEQKKWENLPLEVVVIEPIPTWNGGPIYAIRLSF